MTGPERPGRCVAAVLLAGLFLVGCSGVDQTLNGVGPEVEERNRALLQDVADDVAAARGLVRAEGRYTDSMTDAGSAGIRAACRRCDERAVAEELLGEMWSSEVSPLVTLTVSVTDLASFEEVVLTAVVSQERERLVEQYGERPVPDAG